MGLLSSKFTVISSEVRTRNPLVGSSTKMKKGGVVYIVTNKHHTVFYTGVTSDLPSRIMQHRDKKFPASFTAKYNIYKLAYYESLSTIAEAISRESKSRNIQGRKNLL